MSPPVGSVWPWRWWSRLRRAAGALVPSGAGLRELGLWAMAAAVMVSMLLLGGVGAFAVLATSVAAFAAFAALWFAGERPGTHVLALALVLPCFTLLQAVPLPTDVAQMLSPEAASLRADVTKITGEAVVARLSLDAPATYLEALKWFTYALLFLAALAVARTRGARPAVLIVFCSAALCAAITLGHAALGQEVYLGLYSPRYVNVQKWWGVAPFVNANNLAGYLNLGVFCGLAWLVRVRGVVAVSTAGLGVASLIAVVVLSGSRAGVASLCVGLLASSVLFVIRREHRRVVFVLGGAAAGGVAMAMLAATGQVWRDLTDESLAKLRIAQRSAAVLWDYPLTGIGRGAFDSVFGRYSAAEKVVYQHAENFVAQWLVEWGLIVGGLAVAGSCAFLLALIWRVARGWSVSYGLGALGLAVFFAQNLFDLATEVAGTMGAVAVLAGTLWGKKRQPEAPSRASVRPRSSRQAGSHSGSILAVALALGWATAVFMVALDRTEPVHGRRVELAQAYEALRGDQEAGVEQWRALRREIGVALARHPAEPYFVLLGAVTAGQLRSPDALVWVGWALRAEPNGGHPHLAAAHELLRRGASNQALLHLREAAQRNGALVDMVAQVLAAIRAPREKLLEAVPAGKVGGVLLRRWAELTPDAAGKAFLLKEAVARDPEEWKTRALYAGLLVDELAFGRCPVGPAESCVLAVRDHLPHLSRGSGTMALQYEARLRSVQGDPTSAFEWLSPKCPGDDQSCIDALLWLSQRSREQGHLKQALARYVSVRCTIEKSPEACAAANRKAGDMLGARGDWLSAVPYLERAAQLQASADGWARLQHAAEIAHLPQMARRARLSVERARLHERP